MAGSRGQQSAMNHPPLRLAFVFLALGFLCAACNDDDVRAYRAPKAPPPRQAPAQPAPSEMADVTWTVPEGWKQVPSDQAMRVATFRAGGDPGVEVSVTAFPGDVGGTLANVNRWRGQVGLAPATEQDLPSMLETVRVEGVEVSTLALSGSKGQDMLGAMIKPGDSKTWFVKASAEPKAAEALKPAFVAFARSFKMSKGAAPAAHPPIRDAAPTPAQSAGDVDARLAAFTPPSHWKKEPDSSGILAAAYGATNADGGARATATTLAGDGGGMLANINRWRDQLGLTPVAAMTAQPTTDLGKGAVEVDLADASGIKRMIAAIVPSGGQTWFFKLTGTPKGVEAEKVDFDRFVRSVGLGEP